MNGSLIVLVRLVAVSMKGEACAVAGRHGSRSPSIIAKRGYDRLNPPCLLMVFTSGGVVMLNDSAQTIELCSRVLRRDTRGRISAGTPDPVWR